MRTFLLNKMVADRKYVHMRELGQEPQVHILNDEEFMVALDLKLEEEKQELAESFTEEGGRPDKEFLDVIDVLRQQALVRGHSADCLPPGRADEVGAFSQRVYIGAISLREEDPLLPMYLADPDKFPEVS